MQQAGASELTVHGRTKEDGYKADRINWAAIGEIRQRLSIPVIANGEIWDYQSAQDCLQATGCDAIMLGRGAQRAEPEPGGEVQRTAHARPQVVELLQKYVHLEKQGDTGLYHVARIKQWLGYLRKEYDEATELFSEIRALTTSGILRVICRS